MKAAFITSLVSALMSLVAILCLSAISVAPGAKGWAGHMMLITAVFFVVWLSLAFWLRPRPSQRALPFWAQGLLVSVGAVYAFGVLLIAIG